MTYRKVHWTQCSRDRSVPPFLLIFSWKLVARVVINRQIFPALNVTLWFLYVLSFLCQSTDHSVAHGKCREGLQACEVLWDTTSPGLAVLCLWLMVPVVVGPTIQATGMGTDLLTRISVAQRKATEGVHMELRKTSDSPRSEENKKTTGRKSNNNLVGGERVRVNLLSSSQCCLLWLSGR